MTADVHSAQPVNTTTAPPVDPERIEAARARALALPAEDRLSMTEAARGHLERTFAGDDGALGLRLGTKKSGCSGFAYVMDAAREIHDDDLWFDCDGMAIVTDEASFPAIRGSTLDYVVEGLTRMLHVDNPNIEDSCGCGESFTVRDEDYPPLPEERPMADKAPTIDAEVQALKDEFAFLGDWTERYQYIMDMGKQMPAFPSEKQDEEHKFHGCQSQVWFDYQWDGDRLQLEGTSDAMIVKGLIALLFRIYSDRTAEEILATDGSFIDDLGLGAHLSANRATGLVNMVERIRSLAAEKAA